MPFFDPVQDPGRRLKPLESQHQTAADLICYITPAEHLALPTEDDVRMGVKSAKIAAYIGDMNKYKERGRERDKAMSKARRDSDWEKQFAESRLDEICEKFLNACPLYIRHISVGEPSTEILKLIKDEEIDLIVMASRGSESHFDFGSGADGVIKCTSTPTLIVPV